MCKYVGTKAESSDAATATATATEAEGSGDRIHQIEVPRMYQIPESPSPQVPKSHAGSVSTHIHPLREIIPEVDSVTGHVLRLIPEIYVLLTSDRHISCFCGRRGVVITAAHSDSDFSLESQELQNQRASPGPPDLKSAC